MTKRKSKILYWDIKACIEDTPKTRQDIAEEIGESYQTIFHELKDLVAMGIVTEVKHDGQVMMLWNDEPSKMEYEMAKNVVEMRKPECQFFGRPSEKYQVKLPYFIFRNLKEKLGFKTRIDLMLEVKAVFFDGQWTRIENK